jgi:hypothetical protein
MLAHPRSLDERRGFQRPHATTRHPLPPHNRLLPDKAHCLTHPHVQLLLLLIEWLEDPPSVAQLFHQ